MLPPRAAWRTIRSGGNEGGGGAEGEGETAVEPAVTVRRDRPDLAESCDDAPADMFLEVWQWWTGSLSTPDRPHGHPNFPRRDLLRYVEDPNPRMRQLALEEPDSTAELVGRAEPAARTRGLPGQAFVGLRQGQAILRQGNTPTREGVRP